MVVSNEESLRNDSKTLEVLPHAGKPNDIKPTGKQLERNGSVPLGIGAVKSSEFTVPTNKRGSRPSQGGVSQSNNQ